MNKSMYTLVNEEDIQEIEQLPGSSIHYVLVEAAFRNKLKVVKHFMPSPSTTRRIREYTIAAANGGSIDVLEYIAGDVGVEKLKESGAWELVGITLLTRGRKRAFGRWVEMGGEITKRIVETAAYYSEHVILKWLLVNHGNMGAYVGYLVNEGTTDEYHTLKVMHEHGVDGEYRKDCESGECNVCKEDNVWNMWSMEDMEYSENVQWLPKEMMKDVLLLMSGIC